jgi:hypothetical protein
LLPSSRRNAQRAFCARRLERSRHRANYDRQRRGRPSSPVDLLGTRFGRPASRSSREMKALDGADRCFSQSDGIGASTEVIALRAHRWRPPAWLGVRGDLVVAWFARPLEASVTASMRRHRGRLRPSTASAGDRATTGRAPASCSGQRCYCSSSRSAIAFRDSPNRSGWQGRAISHCRNVGELTGGRFAATIIRGLSGEQKQVWGVTNF